MCVMHQNLKQLTTQEKNSKKEEKSLPKRQENYLVHKRKHIQQKLHPLLPPQPKGQERISMKQSQLHPQLKLLLQLQTPLVHQEACHME